VTGASQIGNGHKPKAPVATKPGERLGQVAPRGVSVPGNGVARGKPTAPGQVKKGLSGSEHGSAKGNANATKSHPTKPTHPTKPANANSGTRVAGTKRSNATKPKSSDKATTTVTRSGGGNAHGANANAGRSAHTSAGPDKPANDNAGGGKKP
jgi:hypothetical protein